MPSDKTYNICSLLSLFFLVYFFNSSLSTIFTISVHLAVQFTHKTSKKAAILISTDVDTGNIVTSLAMISA